MSLLGDYSDPDVARKLSAAITRAVGDRPCSIMEVCGGQTHTIYKYRLRDLLPESVRLVSGPGCPVCVTPIRYIDAAVSLGLDHGALLCTFGDLLRVPGTVMSLEGAAAQGARIEIVYSPLQAVERAEARPDRQVVLLGIGFETTLPGIGLALLRARERALVNFSVLLSAKRVPPVLDALLGSGRAAIDGFITPGHVTAVIGTKAYDGLCARYGVPMAVGGFEPLDLLGAIHMLVGELARNGSANLNAYGRAVSAEGNLRAQQVIEEVFEERDGEFRGLGVIPGGGYGIRGTFSAFDAERRFDINVESREPAGCRCGEILCGILQPWQCPLFGTDCTPDTPVGSCMVSNEGACSAAFLYGG